MRGIAFAVLLMGCATATPALVDGQSVESLTPLQMEQAFAGRAMCSVNPDDGACDTISLLESRSGRSLRFRDIGANDIGSTTGDAFADVIRSLPMFARHDPVFRRLYAERAEGDFRYLKTVTLSRAVLNEAGDRWCEVITPGQAFERVEFYFSNDLLADVSADVRVSPESERGLRAFLRDLTTDADLRAMLEEGATTPAMLLEVRQTIDLMAGAQSCWAYRAVARGARLDLTHARVFVHGEAVPHLDRPLRMLSLDEPLALRAN